MVKNALICALLLVGAAALSLAQGQEQTDKLPLLTFADLNGNDSITGPFKITGYVIDTYKCPPCPPPNQCKPCLGDHITITGDLDEKDPKPIRRLRIFTDKPEQFELKNRYLFTVKVRGTLPAKRSINDVELINFEQQPAAQSTSVTQSPDVIEAYRVCQNFERVIAKNLDFTEAYEATFVLDQARRRAIAIADGEFGDLDFAKLDDVSLIKAYKLRMQIFYLALPLASPSDAEERIYFPPMIKAILERKAPNDTQQFAAYVSQLERDAKQFRAHLDRLATDNPSVAERIAKFKSDAFAAVIEPPTDRRVEPNLGYIGAGVLDKNEAHYEINNYLVANEHGKMRIFGLRFFNRMF